MERNVGHLEGVIESIGGCGKFQVLFAFIVQSLKVPMGFSMVAMTFSGAIPDWWCDDIRFDNVTQSHNGTNNDTISGFKECMLPDGNACSKFRFDDSMSTVISKWNLVCGDAWIPSLTTSLQMVGVLIGNSLSGQIADLIGRKPPLFMAMVILLVFNVMAAFATSWIMFSIARFAIGIGCGFVLTLQYTIVSEVTPTKWRSMVVAFPSWALMLTLFALMSFLTKHWQYVHITTAIVTLPFLATWWFVPESFRWYVSHDKAKDAQTIIERIAKFNKRTVPEAEMLNGLVEAERALSANQNAPDKRYTFLDVLRNRALRIKTAFFFTCWFSLVVVSWGIQFGVPALSGDIYVNMFIVGVVNIPALILSIFLTNWIGRKRSAILCLTICAVTTLCVGLASTFPVLDFGGWFKNACAILALAGGNMAFPSFQIWTIESYPTVVRNISYGTLNSVARIGAILGPQLVFLDSRHPGSMYYICATVCCLSILCSIQLPETKHRNLPDRIRLDSN